MVRGMLQECCHLPRHRQPLIVYYTDSGLSSQLVLETTHNYVESWSVDSGASVLAVRSKPGTYWLTVLARS